jgi:hemerythrin-like metal-binding protein
MAALTWSDALALQQPRMDSTHHEFVELLAAVERALGGSIPAVDEALARFVEHTERHFADEERWMVGLGFAAQNCHAYQHAHVLQVLREVDGLWRSEGDLNLVRQLVGELAKWFPVHAQSMDAALAQTMAEQGFDPDTGLRARAPATDAAPITGCGSASCA